MIEIVSILGSNKKPKGFESGFITHGDQYIVKSLNDITGSEQCYYHFGGISNKKNIYSEENFKGISLIQQSKKPFLVGEYTPFRQIPSYTKIGWLSYNYKDGIFNNHNVTSNRWNTFKRKNNLKIHDWKHYGNNILIMGQLEYDSALNNLYSSGYEIFYDWVFDVVEKIRSFTDRPIVIRPHPKNFLLLEVEKRCLEYKNVSVSKNFEHGGYNNTRNGGSGLLKDLETAYFVVSYSSNSTVEAVCQGIPIYLEDPGSAAFELSQKTIYNIEDIDYSKDIDSWGRKIVYSIWNTKEISSGECWGHLKSVFFN